MELKKNVDILKSVSSRKKNRPGIVVGFAAETNNHIENAKKKLLEKNCDAIVVNKIDKNNPVFNSDLNRVSFITKDKIFNFKKQLKISLAKKLIDLVYELKA